MAFGVLPKKMLEDTNLLVLEALIKNAVPKGNDSDDAETRKQAIKSLVSKINSIGVSSVPHEMIE